MNVFISHANADSNIAKTIANAFKEISPDIETFVSSRPGDIGPGREWLPDIQRAIREATHYIILLTPNSIRRPWVWFECGAVWMSEKQHILCRTSDLSVDEIPHPLNTEQINMIDDIEDVNALFKSWNLKLLNSDRFVAEIKSAIESTNPDSINERIFEGITYNGTFYAWAGPLISLQDLEPIPKEPGLIEYLRENGFELYDGKNINKELEKYQKSGYNVIYATDKETFKRKIGDNSIILTVCKDKNI